MRIKETKIYHYEELSDEAKKKARDWFRQDYPDYWERVYDDANTIGLTITSFDLGNRKDIQGYLKTSVQQSCIKILEKYGPSCETYKLAEQWQAKSEALDKAIAEHCDDDADEERSRLEDEQDQNEKEYEYALLQEYFLILDKEYEYLNSDEQVENSIIANEYEFTEEGRIA